LLYVGLDIGSTTAKVVALDGKNRIKYKTYRRHFSNIQQTVLEIMQDLEQQTQEKEITLSFTGSSGLSFAAILDMPFVQEVIACTEAVEKELPDADIVIELGGEDAKIIYITGGIEQRMNSACAGGTGAFIDQIASLLKTDANGLNELALGGETIYPIASRCGVFAKTDVQPLLNEGAKKEDIALSIFQSTVTQVIAGLACGRPIKGKIAFLGGPLTFLTQLRARFAVTLDLADDDVLAPADAQYFIALGAAITGKKGNSEKLADLITDLKLIDFSKAKRETTILPPLFSTEKEYENFSRRHGEEKAPKGKLAEYMGNAYLGIDAGSTTTKIVLMGGEHEILYTHYCNNGGNPLQSVIDSLEDLYKLLPENVRIAYSGITGYGEALIREGLNIDIGQIETVAHYRAAREFLPDVDLILDIGGQDMKCMRIKNQSLDSLMLNEACSAGCGSFLESLANTLNISLTDFVQEALYAEQPVDLGSRCTVFMNSKVKQVQKEGATIGELAAGLSYSVIKNALQKVIKLRNPADLGEKIVVQGGTFYNDAVLRALELSIGREVIRPDISGLMGAYGMALLAQEQYETGTVSNLLLLEKLQTFSATSEKAICGKCNNTCQLTVTHFGDDKAFVSGNRCERGAQIGNGGKKNNLPNLYEYKYRRYFNYRPLSIKNATRGTIGIPRALNIFENYPIWFTIFNSLGYRVILSSQSSKEIFDKGIATIASESVCYPAKLVHGHIMDLVEKDVDRIFYPSVVYENPEFSESTNNFNCPVVAGYPEVIRVNVDALHEKAIPMLSPFLTLDNEAALIEQMQKLLPEISAVEVETAVKAGLVEMATCHADMHKQGEDTLRYMKLNNIKGVVLAGHPYHVDPEVNHGIADLITMYGMAVLTEDSVAHLGEIEHELRVENQWVYHARLYRAASFVAKHECLEFVQLTSFGCGLDAITSDMCQEIIESSNKIYTLLKIDEISNLGAARIRIRSLKAAVEEREKNQIKPYQVSVPKERKLFTKEMKKQGYTILIPQLAPTQFEILVAAGKQYGYNFELLPPVTPRSIDEGLRYVNNDACYPAIVTIGQMVDALKYGNYDLDKVAVLMSQTGGGCRATNYISLIRKAFYSIGWDDIPVISFNVYGIEKHPGFNLPLGLMRLLLVSISLGDAIDRMTYRMRPYELVEGSVNKIRDQYVESCRGLVQNFSMTKYKKLAKRMVNDFDRIPINYDEKPRVGVVGEILVKFHPGANNNLIDIIENEGGEAVVPDFIDFVLYCCYDDHFAVNTFNKSKLAAFVKESMVVPIIYHYREPLAKALKTSRHFTAPESIEHVAEKASKLLSLGNNMGEGWFLTGEMLELIESGVSNIACLQPFACLPNHITGRGMIKGIKALHPEANIMAIDYDAGVSAVNQLNRIKLLIAIANKKIAMQHQDISTMIISGH
jgi:CoA-substrate-specific enzyme activase, putative